MAKRVAVVTGSNKGLGLATVRSLCKKFDGDVFLTSRDEGRGMAAVKALEEEGLHPKFHQLDISSQDSINKLKTSVEKEYGGIDILVNNAAIAYGEKSEVLFAEQAYESVRCNFYGPLNVSIALFPLLRPHSRVVNVSSIMGKYALDKMSQELREKFQSPTLTIQELTSLEDQFVSDTKEGNHTDKGWPNMAYGVSKLGVLAMTYVMARDIMKDPREDILINCCCPGSVITDMSGNTGNKTPDEAAQLSIHLAMLPPNTDQPQGEFLKYDKVLPWR